MVEEKSLIVKLSVPVVILLSLCLSGTCAYYGWFDPAASNAHEGLTILVLLIAYMSFGIAFFMLIGIGAKHVGYKKDELDRWGDEAMYGKPPL
jgi:heme/copper-type cytochrome/quinol oxidase subunit 2